MEILQRSGKRQYIQDKYNFLKLKETNTVFKKYLNMVW
jgi:hypothetical protein